MAKRLLLVRNPDSKLLTYVNLDRDDQEIVLLQNGVFSEELAKKNVKFLKDDAIGAGIDAGGKEIDYDGLLDAVFASDKVFCI